MKKITLFNYLFSVILLLGLIPNMSAQKQNANWYFGNQAGINFNDGTQPPTALTNGVMNTEAGTASASDDSGNLLFYTNGVSVWNKNHVIMTNGNLIGKSSVAQSVVIVPKPGNSDQYYIFSNSADDITNAGLRYSIVDMAADGGLGDVDSMEKDVLLLATCSEKMTAILNPFDNTYWVVAFGPYSDLSIYNEDRDAYPYRHDTFYSFKVDLIGGVNPPVESPFYSGEFYKYDTTYSGGQMKISPDYFNLAMVHNADDRGENAEAIYVFDFNAGTGIISAYRNYYVQVDLNYDNTYFYGLEFSPDSNMLFVSTIAREVSGASAIPFGEIFQIQYRSESNYFERVIHANTDSSNPIYSLQLGIDKHIYASRGIDKLDVIYNPDYPSVQNVDFREGYFNLSPKLATKGLPQFVPESFTSQIEKNKPKKPVVQGNPFKDELKLKFKYIQDYTMEFYNSMGTLAKTEVYDTMTNRKIYKLDTSELPTDTYYVIIRDEQGQVWYDTLVRIP